MSNELSLSNAQRDLATVSEATSVARATQEVQAQIILAKKFPRDVEECILAIRQACSRPSLASLSKYEYKRGNETVEGPSIRLMETIALAWGNMEFGFRELDSNREESKIECFAWDQQRNVRAVRSFSVKHSRTVRADGGHRTYALTDPRDVQENVANQAQRKVRVCLEAIIPRDIVEMACEQCEKTLKSADKDTPIGDKIIAMLERFQQFGVTKAMIEAKVQRKCESITETQLARLRKIYTAIKDGVATPEEHFTFESPSTGSRVEDEVDKMLKKKPAKKEEPADEEPTVADDTEDFATLCARIADKEMRGRPWYEKYVAGLANAQDENDCRQVSAEMLPQDKMRPSELSDALRLRDLRIEQLQI